MADLQERQGLRLMVLTCSAANAKKADALMQKAHLPLRYQFRAEGTATSEMLDYFGLENTEKTVLICAMPKTFVPKLMDALQRALYLGTPGSDILFSVPVSGISSPMFKLMDAKARESIQTKIESEVQSMEENAGYSLVLATVNKGYSDDVMEAAKAAGIKGGTVIHARRLGMEEAMQFWGISLQSEKDIVAILAPRAEKMALMRAIGEHCGLQSKAQGFVLSLPVDDVAGLE